MILIPASEDITVYIFSHHLSPRFLVCIFLACWTSAVQCPQVPQSHHTYREPSLKKFPWTTLFFFITLSSFAPSSPFHSLSLLCQLVYCLLSASLKCKVHEGQNHLSYLPLSSESITCPEHSRHSISISWMDKGMLKTEVNTSSPPNKYTCFLSYCIVTIISPPIPYLKIMVNFSFYVLPTSLSKSFPEPFALSFSILGLQLSCTWLMIVPSFFTNHPLLPPGTFSLGMRSFLLKLLVIFPWSEVSIICQKNPDSHSDFQYLWQFDSTQVYFLFLYNYTLHSEQAGSTRKHVHTEESLSPSHI